MRPEKTSIVADLSEKLNRSPFVLVTDYQRMNVNHFADLRNRLAVNGAEMHVVKNSFLKRAMVDSGLPDVTGELMGQTAVVTGEKDVAPVAKILKMFAAEFKIAAMKIGVIDKAVLSIKDLEVLAELPAREVLLSQLLGLLMSPATKLVRLFNEPGSALARILEARRNKMPAPQTVEAAPKEELAPPKEEATPKEEPVKMEPPAPESPGAEAPAAEATPPETPAAEAASPETAATEVVSPETPATNEVSGSASPTETQKEGEAAGPAAT